MEHLSGEQYSEYSVESNPRAYMSMMDYRNQWMSSPYGSDYNYSWGNHTNSSWEPRPPQYSPPEPPYNAPTSQQQPPTLSPVEQAILNLSKQVDNFIEEQRAVIVQANQETATVESSLNKKLDGFQSEIDKKLDILQESISKLTNQLVHQDEENPEGWCLTDIMAEEQCEQQPHQELMEDFIELSDGLAESLDMCDVVFPRENQEEIIALLTEEGNETKEVEVPKKNVLQPIPTELNPTATAQATKCPLPVAPSTDQVYILPSPASQPTSKTPALKGKSNTSLHAMQNFKRLVASVHKFATTSKAQAAAYTAWHNGWFGCGFGFGAPEPRHF